MIRVSRKMGKVTPWQAYVHSMRCILLQLAILPMTIMHILCFNIQLNYCIFAKDFDNIRSCKAAHSSNWFHVSNYDPDAIYSNESNRFEQNRKLFVVTLILTFPFFSSIHRLWARTPSIGEMVHETYMFMFPVRSGCMHIAQGKEGHLLDRLNYAWIQSYRL